MRRPLRQREPVLQLVRQAAERHRRLRRRVGIPLEQPAVVLVAKRIVGQQNVADVPGPTLAPLDRPPAEHRPAAQPRADDRDEQRIELLVRQRLRRHAVPRQRSAANRILAQRRRLAVAEIAHRDTRRDASPSAACKPARIGKLSHNSRLRFGVDKSTPSIVAGPGVASPTVATSASEMPSTFAAASAAPTIAAIELSGPFSGVVRNWSET